MLSLALDLLFLAGMALIVGGIAMIYIPASLIVAGGALCALSYLSSRPNRRVD